MAKKISLDKIVEGKVRKLAHELGFKDTPLRSEGTHQIELQLLDQKSPDYVYISRFTGVSKGELQVTISPEQDQQLSRQLLKISGVKSALPGSDAGLEVQSSQYKGFNNKQNVGEHRGKAWRINLSDSLEEIRSFLTTYKASSTPLKEYDQVSDPRNTDNDLTEIDHLGDDTGSFDQFKNFDERTLQSIKTRRGQPEFRKALLTVFQGQCVISKTNVQSVLEAAHIIPHAEESNYSVSNGLLLRADLHTLFDLNQIGIDGYGNVHVCSELKGSDYAKFNGIKVLHNIPKEMVDNLTTRFGQFHSQLGSTQAPISGLPAGQKGLSEMYS